VNARQRQGRERRGRWSRAAAGGQRPIAADPASKPCVAYDFCCNGPPYQAVVLTEEEEKRTRARPLPVLQSSQPPRIQQPCPFHRNSRCEIRAERFASCASHGCELLEQVQAGSRGLESALFVAHEVKTAQAEA
jgi:hypothetical protein